MAVYHSCFQISVSFNIQRSSESWRLCCKIIPFSVGALQHLSGFDLLCYSSLPLICTNDLAEIRYHFYNGSSLFSDSQVGERPPAKLSAAKWLWNGDAGASSCSPLQNILCTFFHSSAFCFCSCCPYPCFISTPHLIYIFQWSVYNNCVTFYSFKKSPLPFLLFSLRFFCWYFLYMHLIILPVSDASLPLSGP